MARAREIRVVYMAPGSTPEEKMVKNELPDLQALIGGGYLETFSIQGAHDIMGLCDEEGRLKKLPFNFSNFPGNIIVGPCFFVRDGGEYFRSLTDKQVGHLMNIFSSH